MACQAIVRYPTCGVLAAIFLQAQCPGYAAPELLLVEQEVLLLKFLKMILERAGFGVLSVATTEKAVRVVHEFSATLDLLLIGASMIGQSSLELAKNVGRTAWIASDADV